MIKTNFLVVFIRNKLVTSEKKEKYKKKKPAKTAEQMSLLTRIMTFSV